MTGDTSASDDRLFDEYLDRVLDGERIDASAFLRDKPDATPSLVARLKALNETMTKDGSTDLPKSDSDDDLPFASVSGFRLIRRIGRGGMGSVFLAEQTSLSRLVALKVIDDSRGVSESARARFLEEAQAIAEISHPNIVSVIEYGESEGLQYMVMELVTGRDLDCVLESAALEEQAGEGEGDKRQSTIPMHRILRWFMQLAQALDHAHRRGIIHRDVKPSNIQITLDDDAILLDFGLARPLDRKTRTLPGIFLGTAAYASPEQSDSRPGWSTPLTDIYSLGASLYRTLAGQLPIPGESHEEVLRNILTKDPTPLRKIHAAIPRDVATVVEKAMERDPKNRYQSAAQFASDLQAVIELRPISARPASLATRGVRWVRRHPIASNSAFVAIAGLAVLAIVMTMQGQTRATDATAHIDEAVAHLQAYDNLVPAVQHHEERLRYFERQRDEKRFALRSARETLDRSVRRHEKLLARPDPRSGHSEAELESKLRSLRSRIENNQKELDRIEASYSANSDETSATLSRDFTQLQAALSGAEDAIEDAERLQPELSAIADARVDLYMRQWRDAKRLGNAEEESTLATIIRTSGLGAEFDLELRGMAQLDCSSLPRNAELHLFRYAYIIGSTNIGYVSHPLTAPGRWFPTAAFGPLPLGDGPLGEGPLGKGTLGEGDLKERPLDELSYTEASSLSASRLGVSKIIEVEQGSYLLVARKQNLRIPLRLHAGETVIPSLDHSAQHARPPGFITIPNGAFLAGGDMFAANYQDRRRVQLKTFWIMQNEVSWAEYAQFLNSSRHEVEPKDRQGRPIWSEYRDARGEYSIPDTYTQLPMVGVTFEDAQAYAAWRSKRAQQQGDPFRFCLPNELEWEKACRGADGRAYPWGNSWSGVSYFRLSQVEPEMTISDHLRDRSVYGLRNVIGNVTEICTDISDGSAILRGLSFATGFRHHHAARLAGRIKPMSPTDEGVGFRLVAHLRDEN